MRYLMSLTGVLACLLTHPSEVAAACVCRCVDGEVRAICSSSIDVAPICAPAVCPITPPSVSPIPAPRVPPIGTDSCRMAQVLNPRTGQYEWRQVCR